MNGLTLAVEGTVDALRANHDVDVLAYRTAAQAGDIVGARLIDMPALTARRKAELWASGAARREPWQVKAFADGLRRELQDALRRVEPDVVHVFSGRLAGLGPLLVGLPTVLSALDAWHLNADASTTSATGLRRAGLAMQARFVRRFEASAYRQFDRVAVLSERDRAALAAIGPDLRLSVVPHGVDSRRYRPDSAPRSPTTIVMHGVMCYPPNVDAARALVVDILPLVRTALPDVTVSIVGRDPSPEVNALAEVPGVEVTGAVDDVRPWLERAGVYACPMRTGGGVKNKVLEAMATGAPCVTSSVAANGLATTPGRHLLMADEAPAFAAAVVRVLTEPALAEVLGRAARDLVVEQHSWSAVASAYSELYEAVAAEHPTRSHGG